VIDPQSLKMGLLRENADTYTDILRQRESMVYKDSYRARGWVAADRKT